ncbi:transposase [Bacillus licheniformis]|uniref:transposase n=1 Tax=Bacillus licheniformis TaxID=1402 RepID=UPI0039C31DF5
MEEAIDFSFIYQKVAPLYSSKGRPSIDPVVLIKMVLIQYVFGHRSMRETIERVFADLKHKHGLRWTTLRGKKKLSMQAMLVFAAMNLKKLANWTWKGPNRQPSDRNNRIKWTKTGRIFKIRPVLSTV